MPKPLTSPSDMDRAIAQQAAQYRLINCNGLDLIHIHFSGMPSNESGLYDHSAVGNGYFGDPLLQPFFDCEKNRS